MIYFRLIIIFLYFFILPCSVFATYTLPYPSYMPGNKLYSVSRIIDAVKEYWYWGKLGQAKYHLALADKYLVEAKTLFEYKQYLLAVDGLKRSDEHIKKVPMNKDAMLSHVEVLNYLLKTLPEQFTWTPEKGAATQLNLHEIIKNSINIRKP